MMKMRSTSFRLLLLLLVVSLIRGNTRGNDNFGEGTAVDIPVPPTNVLEHGQKQKQQPTVVTKFCHLIVLVHGYLGSEREQEYLGEALSTRGNTTSNTSPQHDFVILYSTANVGKTTDGIAPGGKRLAAEIYTWIQHYQHEADADDNNDATHHRTIVTLSIIGNSLGGLYSRYALGELYYNRTDYPENIFRATTDEEQRADGMMTILPLVFCSTSSPHLGVSQELFLSVPHWLEPYLATGLQQQTLHDLFSNVQKKATIVYDMCDPDHTTTNDEEQEQDDTPRNYLRPLQLFHKRIAVANAYNTDFLVSVASAAFLSADSTSLHYAPEEDDDVKEAEADTATVTTATCSSASSSSSSSSTSAAPDEDEEETTSTTNPNTCNRLPSDRPPNRWMEHMDMVLLQVTTTPDPAGIGTTMDTTKKRTNSNTQTLDRRQVCAENLDQLGWHKIFLDTRALLPSWMVLPLASELLAPSPAIDTKTTSTTQRRSAYTSQELYGELKRYGTLLPIAHPLNMANAKTPWYRSLTARGQPIMDALADLLVTDIRRLAEQTHIVTHKQARTNNKNENNN